MSVFAETTRAATKPPGLVRSILFGTGLGVISAVAGFVCFHAWFFTISFAYGFYKQTLPLRWLLDPQPYVMLMAMYAGLAVVYTMYAIGPATIGGGVIGLIFQRLARRGRLVVWVSVGIGALIGLIEGMLIDWIVAPIPLSGQGWFPDLPHGLLYNGAISVISGLFVSMILYVWFAWRLSRGTALANRRQK